MKSFLYSSSLFAALKKLKPIVKCSDTLPILESVLLQFHQGKLRCTVTDLEISKSVCIPVENDETFSVAVTHNILHDFLKAFDDVAVLECEFIKGCGEKIYNYCYGREVEVPDQLHIKYTVGNAKGYAKLFADNAEDYPRIPLIDEEKRNVSFTVTDEMLSSFRQTSSFAYRDIYSSRSDPAYLCFQFQSGLLTIIGYSKIMYAVSHEVECNKTHRVFVPVNALKSVNAGDIISFQFEKDYSFMEIESDDELTTCRVQNSAAFFPKKEVLDSVFNLNYNQRVELQCINGRRKKDSIHFGLSKILPKKNTYSNKFNLQLAVNGEADFTSKNGTLSIPCSHSGEDVSISLHGESFCELLKTITSEDAMFHFVEGKTMLAYQNENELALIRYENPQATAKS